MAWIYLTVAGLFEIAWAIGLKYTDGFTRLLPSLWTVASMILSIVLLGLALRTLPVGTAYAVWTGIGAIGIAALGMDHEAFLGTHIVDIAGEKAGIAKPGVPLVTMNYPASCRARIAAVAGDAGAPVIARNADWWSETARQTMRYRDRGFAVVTHRPRLVGPIWCLMNA